MAVNKNFYTTINELTNRSITGDVTTPIDAATWIDYGKTMQQLDGQNLVNGFLMEPFVDQFLNRIVVISCGCKLSFTLSTISPLASDNFICKHINGFLNGFRSRSRL